MRSLPGIWINGNFFHFIRRNSRCESLQTQPNKIHLQKDEHRRQELWWKLNWIIASTTMASIHSIILISLYSVVEQWPICVLVLYCTGCYGCTELNVWWMAIKRLAAISVNETFDKLSRIPQWIAMKCSNWFRLNVKIGSPPLIWVIMKWYLMRCRSGIYT